MKVLGFLLNGMKIYLPITNLGFGEKVRTGIASLNTMLQLLVNVGCVEYWPGWCTRYSTAAETRKVIMVNVERLWTYYKKTYQEGKEDD